MEKCCATCAFCERKDSALNDYRMCTKGNSPMFETVFTGIMAELFWCCHYEKKKPREYRPGDGPWWAEQVGKEAWEIKALVYDAEYVPLPRLSEVNACVNVKMLNRVCRDWAEREKVKEPLWNDARKTKPNTSRLVLVCYNMNMAREPYNIGMGRWSVSTHPDQWEVYFPEMCDYETNTIHGGNERVTHWAELPMYPFIEV